VEEAAWVAVVWRRDVAEGVTTRLKMFKMHGHINLKQVTMFASRLFGCLWSQITHVVEKFRAVCIERGGEHRSSSIRASAHEWLKPQRVFFLLLR
jgi:hypothetical protein